MSPQQQNDLWLKLVQQAAIAQTQAPGAQTQADDKSARNPDAGQAAGDARTYAQQYKPTDPAVANGISAFSDISAKNVGDITVKSTGNPVADALLILAGFRGL
jgi:hypothetical protein